LAFLQSDIHCCLFRYSRPYIVKIIERGLDSKGFFGISADRKRALSGVRLGEGRDLFTEVENALRLSFTVTATFTVSGKKVVGKANLRPTDTSLPRIVLDMTGGFYDSDFLQLTYKGTVLGRRQLGVTVLRFHATGDILEGYYSAFSPIREMLIAGNGFPARLNIESWFGRSAKNVGEPAMRMRQTCSC
jgi:hypothetical protein